MNTESDMTVGQVSELTGVHVNTLVRWEAAGEIPPAKRDGRHRRVWTQDQVTEIVRYVSRGA